MKMESGLIYDIKRYAINDGPGIRTTVFLKGCPLHCAWCHNPEGICPSPQRVYTPSKCIGCEMCISACPEKALALKETGIAVDQHTCVNCGVCAAICPSTAVEIFGRKVTVADIVKEIEKDALFFDQSGGGVTFSGGEPLGQAEFLEAALKALGQVGVHRAVDTTGHTGTATLLRVAAHTDLFLYDLKHMDAQCHRQWTGVGNALILKNLRALAETGAKIWIRIPLIQGVNADSSNIRQTAAFLSSLPQAPLLVNLLPYHDIMAGKYQKLGQTFNETCAMSEPDTKTIEAARDLFARNGMEVVVGG
nr:glycyl-radical enzyme activating protein [uncultured Desulfobacter sp.]